MKTINQLQKLIDEYKSITGLIPNILFLNEFYCKELLKENGLPYSRYKTHKGGSLLGLVIVETEQYDLKVARIDRIDLLLPTNVPQLNKNNIIDALEASKKEIGDAEKYVIINDNQNYLGIGKEIES